MDNDIDIKATLAKRFFTSAEDEKLAENFKKLGPPDSLEQAARILTQCRIAEGSTSTPSAQVALRKLFLSQQH